MIIFDISTSYFLEKSFHYFKMSLSDEIDPRVKYKCSPMPPIYMNFEQIFYCDNIQIFMNTRCNQYDQ
jgi:hypothetical protein